jgi:5-hydroxyisourate hydrolase
MTHSISTHVLDTERGEPARGVPVMLSRWETDRWVAVTKAATNEDGRIPDLVNGPLSAGAYRIAWDVAAYFRAQGREPPFFTRHVVEFQIANTRRHYHVPLLLAPYSGASYRGS